MDWDYATYRDGRLYDDDGYLLLHRDIVFASLQDAEQYIIDNDLRISIR